MTDIYSFTDGNASESTKNDQSNTNAGSMFAKHCPSCGSASQLFAGINQPLLCGYRRVFRPIKRGLRGSRVGPRGLQTPEVAGSRPSRGIRRGASPSSFIIVITGKITIRCREVKNTRRINNGPALQMLALHLPSVEIVLKSWKFDVWIWCYATCRPIM